MTQWDVIRRLAQQKHDEFCKPGEFASAETLLVTAEEKTRIIRKPVPAGDSLLDGGEAMLDLDAQVIWYNKDVDPGLAAYYQAHEYAHYWIDGLQAKCSVLALDYEALETRVPLGIQRVEEYGPNERSELKANVFAREFLLPSNKLRRWFIEEGLNAQEIGKMVGVYEGMVHHQLAYALLLPNNIFSDPQTQPVNNYPLDESQREAAHAVRGPLLLEAGPGTGKTTALVGRIKFLLEDQKVDPASILALTFSNKAAEEMRIRIAQMDQNAAPKIWMGTFHAFGLEILRKFGTQIGLALNPIVIDPTSALFMLERALPSLALHYYKNLYEPAYPLLDILGAISRAKDELVSPNQYFSLAERMLENTETEEDVDKAEKALEVAGVYKVYESLLAETSRIDFGDLILKSVGLLQSQSTVRDILRQTYQHILVDEYQDVNYASSVFMQELAGSGQGLWVVGDVRQSIYRFRGAAPRNMHHFSEAFPGAIKCFLKRNYRSQPNIVRTFEHFAPQMRASRNETFEGWEPNRSDGEGQVLMEIAKDRESECRGLANTINKLNEQGIPYREQAILCRTHAELARVAEVLENENIPVLYLGNLFEREEIRDLLALISLACEGHGLGLLRVAKFPEYEIPFEDVLALLDLAEEKDRAFPGALSLAEGAAAISDPGKKGIKLLENHLENIAYGTPIWVFIAQYLFNRSNYLKTLLGDESTIGQQKRLAINQFLLFVYEQRNSSLSYRADDKRDFLATIRRLEIFGETKQIRQLPDAAENIDAVRLLTVHASKGLEFRTVFLPFLGAGRFPKKRQYEPCPPPTGMIPEDAPVWHDEEEECLFFVALSRAQNVLCLSRATKYGEKGSNPSKLLAMISPRLPHPPDGNITWKQPPDSESKIEPTFSGKNNQIEFDVQALDMYIQCPQKYYNEYALSLGGKREDSAYVKFHRCVYAVLYWLLDEHNQGHNIAEEILHERLSEVWSQQGPINHPFEDFYHHNAIAMLTRALRRLSSDQTSKECPVWEIQLQEGRIKLQPDRIVVYKDGTQMVQRFRTGRISSSEREDDVYALYQHMRDNDPMIQGIQIIFLSTDKVESVELGERMVGSRLEKYNQAMLGINNLSFPPSPSERVCPRCAYYFICPTIHSH